LTVETLLEMVFRTLGNMVVMSPGMQVVAVVRGNNSKQRSCADGERAECEH